MSWAMELSPTGFNEMLTDLSMMDRKTGMAFLKLCGYLRRFGSVPATENALIGILGVTRRFLRDTSWPLLQDRLESSEDGLRYVDPEITPARARRAARAPDKPEKSRQQSAAATAMWEKKRAAERMQADALAHAERMRSDAETHVIPMRGASKTHAESDADRMRGASDSASDSASGASASSRAPSLSLSDSSLSESEQNQRDSSGERESARASADAPAHAETDANRMRFDAPAHAESDANRMRFDAPAHAESDAPTDATRDAPGAANASPAKAPRRADPPVRHTRLPEDWKPGADILAIIQKAGRDPEPIAAAFRAHYKANGAARADWDAAFAGWWLRQPAFDPPSQRNLPPMAIKGGANGASPPADPPLSEADKALDVRLRAPQLAWGQNRAECPFMPLAPEYKAEATGAAAYRWLECWEAWNASGRPGRLRPPDWKLFTQNRALFEEDLLRVEEELTQPEAEDGRRGGTSGAVA
jgi:hypothetical protein